MFVVFGQIPINDAIVARYTDERWRGRVYALRYVASFGASTLAVPLVARFYGQSGDFTAVFRVLAGLAVMTALASLWLPVQRQASAPAAAPAE